MSAPVPGITNLLVRLMVSIREFGRTGVWQSLGG
jgi:hypothetical protein